MYFRRLLFFVMLLCLAGCNKSELTVTGPDGELRMSAEYYPEPEDVPGCFEIIAHTDGKDVFTSLWLTCCINGNTRVGEDLNLERVSFGAMLSSDSRNYASSFTGRMILKERTGERVVIGMEDVHFRILHGEYVLNGDLVARDSSTTKRANLHE